MERKWQKDYDKLEEDFDKFRDYFNKNKKCDCRINNCRHFDNALVKVLGERTDQVCQLRTDIVLKRHCEIFKDGYT